MKVLTVVILFLLALLCGYVFLANFEYPGVTWGKIVWGSLGAACLGGAVVLAARKREQR